MTNAQKLYDESLKTITGDRREAYGAVTESFAKVANAWSGILNTPVTPSQVALCMIALKVMREANSHRADNLVDICGYAGLLAELEATPSSPHLETFDDVVARWHEEQSQKRAHPPVP